MQNLHCSLPHGISLLVGGRNYSTIPAGEDTPPVVRKGVSVGVLTNRNIINKNPQSCMVASCCCWCTHNASVGVPANGKRNLDLDYRYNRFNSTLW